jgi:ATP-dependent helicase/nuclease subunit A
MNLVFNASAGTGKTWQVTELYAALVLGKDHEHLPPNRRPVSPEKILLMTFTDNAAAELRSKVAGKLIATKEENDLARQVLRKLPAANISTIHAFCAGLLREHALELGLSPAFQTLEDEARDALLDEVLKGKIFQALETDTDFRDFCSGVSVLGDSDYSLINTIRSLLEKAASRGLDLVDAEAMLPPPERTVCRQSFERIRDELAASGLSQKTVLDALDALNECLSGFPAGLEGLKKFGRIKAVQHLSDELFELKERFLTEKLYEQKIEKFRAFARCLSACATGFTEAKRLRDAVDFGDQLLLARDLLWSGKFKTLFDWIIVDEVQDTSRVQSDVIEALWGKETHLVICGDRKQSIYAWRSADPQVMPDLESAMAQRGGHKRIDLKTSFRSKDRVIDAVNGLFVGIYAQYDALEAQAVLAGEKPCVEFLMQDNDESTTEDEMAAVARRIRLLVGGGAEWRPKYGHDGKTFIEGEPFRYGDILILLKRSTHQSALEKALRDAGIPYTSGGKGYALFEQQEVRDLLLFLQVLCEPTNDLALVGFLRSPFANVPDDEIVRLGWNGETFDHEILHKQFFESGLPAAERLLRYREQTGDKLASQLVREMVRETAFDAQLAGQPGGEQRLANFKKALDWIRAAERGGQVLLPDVVRLFEKYIKTPPRGGAAEALLPDPEQNAVTLMTVHGAKGLTKRVCFVPDISFGDQSDKGFAVFSANTLELKLTGLSGEEIKSPGWDAARKADKAVRDLESVNVFYVAMTRARDLVVLSGAGTQKPDGWLKLSEAFLQSAGPEVLRKVSFAEMPQAEEGVRLEAVGLRKELEYKSLMISKGFERRTVTSLVENLKPQTSNLKPANDRRAFGSLGHAVLEELARNGWHGDISALVELFSAEFGEVEDKLLIPQLEAARDLLREETAGAVRLLAEHPFVLKRDEMILDGTMDLLVQLSNGWKIFDYKFTNETPENALAVYSPQLEAYRQAVQKLYPDADVSVVLVLIGETIQMATARSTLLLRG